MAIILPITGIFFGAQRYGIFGNGGTKDDELAVKNDETMRGFVGLSHCGSPTSVSEVPFGLPKPAFFVMIVCVGNACCFRLGREAKRNGAFAGRGGFLVRRVRECSPTGLKAR